MQLLDLTLETPEENLALDEALLESAEADCVQSTEIIRASTADDEVLRLVGTKAIDGRRRQFFSIDRRSVS